MNRRNVIRSLVASAALPALPVAAGATSLEARKRAAIEALLAVPDDGPGFVLLRMGSIATSLRKGHPDREFVIEMYDAGVPVEEIHRRLLDRIGVGIMKRKD